MLRVDFASSDALLVFSVDSSLIKSAMKRGYSLGDQTRFPTAKCLAIRPKAFFQEISWLDKTRSTRGTFGKDC